MKNLFFVLLVVCAALLDGCSSDSSGAAEPEVKGTFRFHSFLQNGMVIQQEKPFRLWGRATPGVKITAQASWGAGKYTCTADKGGLWTLEVPVPAAPKDNVPQSVEVSTSMQTETLSDLLIGEVWLLSGQSNMFFAMNQVLDHDAEVAAADYPQMRFFTVEPSDADRPQSEWHEAPEPYGRWYTCTPVTAGAQSAVGYYFGRMLHKQLNVPVGLVNTSYGGATAQAYVPLGALKADLSLKENFVDPVAPDAAAMVRPAVFYNAMIHPLLPLSMRGVAWYQGEGNWGNYQIYPLLMKTLIAEWRRNFNQGELPFYCVQIAPYGLGENTQSQEWFYSQTAPYFMIREAQTKIRDESTATGMAVTMDIGDADDIHPTDKRPVGERLARLALNQTYGRTEWECRGPRYKDMTADGGVLKIAFEYADGLTTSDSQAPQHFYVAAAVGEAHRFYPAKAEIHGAEVWLTCPEVIGASARATDVQVRYAYLMYPKTNLQNGAGLPAEPFRTDDWGSGVGYVY